MFVIVLSLTISLFSMPSLRSLSPQGENLNQNAQSHTLKSENRDTPRAAPDDNQWTVQILSSGGFTGRGRGDLLASSDGTLNWSSGDVSCNIRLTGEAVQMLSKLVRAAEVPATKGSLTGMCGDCYVTTMIIHRRDSRGLDSVSTIRWEDASYAGVPADMVAIYDAVMALRECKRQ